MTTYAFITEKEFPSDEELNLARRNSPKLKRLGGSFAPPTDMADEIISVSPSLQPQVRNGCVYNHTGVIAIAHHIYQL